MAFAYVTNIETLDGQELYSNTFDNLMDACNDYESFDVYQIQEIENGKHIRAYIERIEMLNKDGLPTDINNWEYQGQIDTVREKTTL